MIIYVIAGPPGIGKSTNDRAFIPAGVPIIDHDLSAYQYKNGVLLIIRVFLYLQDCE